MDQTLFTAGWLRLKCLAHFLVLSGLKQPQNYPKNEGKILKLLSLCNLGYSFLLIIVHQTLLANHDVGKDYLNTL